MERIITKSFARLMGRGVHRGFITHEELNKSLGKRNLSSENLSQAFLHILDEKISLVEKKSDFKALKKRDSTNKDESKIVEIFNDIKNELKTHDLELRIQELESKFAEDFNQNTFDEINRLKKEQNIN